MNLAGTKTHIWYIEFAYSPVTGAPSRVGLFRRRLSLFDWRGTGVAPPTFIGHFNTVEAARVAAEHDKEHL